MNCNVRHYDIANIILSSYITKFHAMKAFHEITLHVNVDP